MRVEGYRVTREHQGSHWWYQARRDLALRQVGRAARALGHPERRLSLLDYGCAEGFDLPFLAAFGTSEGADVAGVGDAHPADVTGHRVYVVPRDLPRLVG